MLPLVVNLAGRVCVVVGAGPVGRRKATALATAGAAVRMVDPHPAPDLPAGWEVIPEPFRPDHLMGAALVVAAGPDAVNAAVVAAAHARGLWVADAADPGRGTVTFPAVGRAGPVTIAVGTSGAAPAVARTLRDRWLAELDVDVLVWVDLLAEVRTHVLAAGLPPEARRRLLTGFAGGAWLDRLKTVGRAEVRAAMLAAVAQAGQVGGGDAVPTPDPAGGRVPGDHDGDHDADAAE